jgi:hypothetical protein
MVAQQAVSGDRQWFIVGRWQEYAAEARAAVLRLAAIATFYGVQLVQYYWLTEDRPAEETFHRAATLIAVAWAAASLGVLLCLQRRIFPPALKYVSILLDLVLLTALAGLGAGPASPLVFAFFPIVLLAALRFSLPLVWFATLGGLVGYVVLLGWGHPDWFGSPEAPKLVPRVEQLIFAVSLVLTGIVAGQVVRRVRALADEYACRVGEKGQDQ